MAGDFYGLTIPCLFCDVSVAVDGEGYLGVLIGKKAICTGCLADLKKSFEQV